MSHNRDEPPSKEDDLSLYVVWDMQECPRKLLKRGDGSAGPFSCYFALPLPTQIVVFALGKWDGYSVNSHIDVSVCVDSDLPPCHIGTLTKVNRSFCWEATWSQTFLDKSQDEQNRLAKVMASISEDSTLSKSDRETRLHQPLITVFGKKRRSLLSSPASKRWKLTPSDKQDCNRSSPPKSPDLPTPPDTPSQSEGDDAPSGRWGHAVAVLGNQNLLVVGGQGAKQQIVKDSLWLLNTELGNWMQQSCVEGGADRRTGHTVTYDPEKQVLYVFGGSKNTRWLSDVHVLDTTTWTWTALEPNGSAPKVSYHSCTLFAGELFVFGGNFPNPDPEPDGCSNDLYIFNPKKNIWYKPIVDGDIPSPRSGHSASLLGDLLVIFGGWDPPHFCFNDLYFLNMSHMEFSKPAITGIAPSPRSWHASTILSGKRVFIHGGYDGDEVLSDSFIFDLATTSWTEVKNPRSLTPRIGHVAFSLPVREDENNSEQQVAIFGGGNNAGKFYNDYLTFTPYTKG